MTAVKDVKTMNKYEIAIDDVARYVSDVSRGFKPRKKLTNEVDILHELVEKATPKKPKLIKDSFEDYEKCSICGMIVNYGANHCEHCGQALDWSKEQ